MKMKFHSFQIIAGGYFLRVPNYRFYLNILDGKTRICFSAAVLKSDKCLYYHSYLLMAGNGCKYFK